MEEILRRLQLAIRKTSQLENQLTALRNEKQSLKNEVDDLTQELAHKQREHVQLKERYEALKVAKSMDGNEDKGQLQEQINRYLKEIDICLEVLSD